MTAALITNEFVAGPIGAGSSNSGVGCVWGIYSFTKAAQADWVVLSDFDEVHFITGTIDGLSTVNADIDGTTTNKVVFNSATTGAVLLFVVGTPASS